jgi:thiosulfate dehydrogenase [quinone] large subunit
MFDRVLRPSVTPDQFKEPRWARFLFASATGAWIWLVVRLYLASVWIPAGWGKISSGEWLFGDGSPILGMVSGAIASESTPAWYVSFLESVVVPNASLFATLVALGELAVGLGLLVGLLTGIAAFFGVVMNSNFVLAGALGSNPVLIVLGALVMLAWRNAGWIGLDRVLMPWVHERLYAPREPALPQADEPQPADGSAAT